MTIDHRSASSSLQQLLATHTPAELLAKLAPKRAAPAPRVPSGGMDRKAIADRWAVLPGHEKSRPALLDDATLETAAVYARNIENFIGTVNVPVGIAGPLRVNGMYAQGDFYVPLATTEAALVASYSRGAMLITEAGGGTAVVLREGVSRAPGLRVRRLCTASGSSSPGPSARSTRCDAVAESTTRHGKLRDMRVNIEGNHVYLIFDFTTGDASGQNMVTIATAGGLRVHRRALTGQAELRVRRGEPLRRQEGEPAVVPQRPRTQRDVRGASSRRRSSRSGCTRRRR